VAWGMPNRQGGHGGVSGREWVQIGCPEGPQAAGPSCGGSLGSFINPKPKFWMGHQGCSLAGAQGGRLLGVGV
jgi:hypothetical protein